MFLIDPFFGAPQEQVIVVRAHGQSGFNGDGVKGIFGNVPIQSLSQAGGQRFGVGGKLLVQLIDGNGVFGKRLIDRNAFAEILQNVDQRLCAVGFHYVAHRQRRLVIGKLHILSRLRLHKGGAQFGNGRKPTVQNAPPIGRRHRLPPRRVLLHFFINGNSLAQPTRHSVPGHRQRDNVAKLMPQHRPPIRRTPALSRRAVGGNHVAKTHAEKPRIVRHAKGADGKVFLMVEQFEDDPPFQHHSVFAAERVLGLFQKFEHFVPEDGRLFGRHPNEKRIAFQHGILVQSGFQSQQIVGGLVVAVLLVRTRRPLPAFLLLSQPQQILSELQLRLRPSRIQFHGRPLIIRAFLESVFLRELFSDEMIHGRVGFPVFQASLTRLPLAFKIRL